MPIIGTAGGAMGGELRRDVMKPGRSLIRILFGLSPAKKLRRNVVIHHRRELGTLADSSS